MAFLCLLLRLWPRSHYWAILRGAEPAATGLSDVWSWLHKLSVALATHQLSILSSGSDLEVTALWPCSGAGPLSTGFLLNFVPWLQLGSRGCAILPRCKISGHSLFSHVGSCPGAEPVAIALSDPLRWLCLSSAAFGGAAAWGTPCTGGTWAWSVQPVEGPAKGSCSLSSLWTYWAALLLHHRHHPGWYSPECPTHRRRRNSPSPSPNSLSILLSSSQLSPLPYSCNNRTDNIIKME